MPKYRIIFQVSYRATTEMVLDGKKHIDDLYREALYRVIDLAAEESLPPLGSPDIEIESVNLVKEE